MGALKDHALIGRMVISALPQGMTRKSASRFEWDVSGRCQSPVSVELVGRPAADWIQRLKFVVVAKGTKHSLIVELTTPCRKCPACLKQRMKMWAARAMHEVRNARRTWFATFTFSPEAFYAMQCRALAIAEQRCIPTNELTSDEVSARQSEECAKELTLFLKRIRKKVPSHAVRYLLVREKHKSGLPHWHALIHESGAVPIPYRVLDGAWKLGHSKFKLMEDERAAFYVAKYLGKSNEGRVRASIRYGRHDGQTASAIVECEAVDVLSEYRERCEASVGRKKSHKKRTTEREPKSELKTFFWQPDSELRTVPTGDDTDGLPDSL